MSGVRCQGKKTNAETSILDSDSWLLAPCSTRTELVEGCPMPSQIRNPKSAIFRLFLYYLMQWIFDNALGSTLHDGGDEFTDLILVDHNLNCQPLALVEV